MQLIFLPLYHRSVTKEMLFCKFDFIVKLGYQTFSIVDLSVCRDLMFVPKIFMVSKNNMYR